MKLSLLAKSKESLETRLKLLFGTSSNHERQAFPHCTQVVSTHIVVLSVFIF